MKKLLVLATLLSAISAFSQGTVVFNNRVTTVTPSILAQVRYGDLAPGAPAGTVLPVASGSLADGTLRPTVQAGLYGGAAGTAEANLVLLTPAVGFRSGASLGGFIIPGTDPTRTVAGVQPGQPAVFQMRAWDAGGTALLADNSYEGAFAAISASRGVYLGSSGLVNINALGGTPLNGDPPITPPYLQGLTGFNMSYNIVPEPSVIGLGILGALAGLMVFRRRN